MALDDLISTRAEEITSTWGKQKTSKKLEKKQDEDWDTAKSKKSRGGKGKIMKQILSEESTSGTLVR
ncbi:hypothetical protein WUBG_19206 [Wuchereria bancrofti]|uniref:Uncharacterized protein n=1 Tax=Wuchereria bancrofti TaxID=6293 RepID=J9DZ58_WUCBA|nr:hypothetical protein WUBG_19206 [Wuchereria bancrofti]